uniref:(northern house mosquito) hypothetical protein n=1 Tax=Culex pipiens TaxID=7175 RepID=A0A8D8CX81_CULPI
MIFFIFDAPSYLLDTKYSSSIVFFYIMAKCSASQIHVRCDFRWQNRVVICILFFVLFLFWVFFDQSSVSNSFHKNCNKKNNISFVPVLTELSAEAEITLR